MSQAGGRPVTETRLGFGRGRGPVCQQPQEHVKSWTCRDYLLLDHGKRACESTDVVDVVVQRIEIIWCNARQRRKDLEVDLMEIIKTLADDIGEVAQLEFAKVLGEVTSKRF